MVSTPVSTPFDCSNAFSFCISCSKQALKGERRRGREEERERGGEHLVRPLLVGLLDGGDEVLLVHLSAHTSQHAISSSKHLLLLRRLLRCRLLCERLPLEFGGRRR